MDRILTSKDWQRKVRHLETQVPILEAQLETAESELQEAELAAELGKSDSERVDRARRARDEAKEAFDSGMRAVKVATQRMERISQSESVSRTSVENAEIKQIGDQMQATARELESALHIVVAKAAKLGDQVSGLAQFGRADIDDFLHRAAFQRSLREFVAQHLHMLLPTADRREPKDLTERIDSEIKQMVAREGRRHKAAG